MNNEARVFEHVRKYPFVTSANLACTLGLHINTVRRHLRSLQLIGSIDRHPRSVSQFGNTWEYAVTEEPEPEQARMTI
jgi:predicted ArsR family transcriptional regulator